MNLWIKDFFLKLTIWSPGFKKSSRLPWSSLSEEQQRSEIVQLYAMAVCHKDNLPWHDAMDRCHMLGQCDTCQKIAEAFVEVEKVMRSEVMG